MSLEDLDFQSDESDYEAGDLSVSDDGDEELNYLDLVLLHNNLMCFEHIYHSNAMMDMESTENDSWPSFDSLSAELDRIRDYIEDLEVMLSTSSSESSSVTSHGDATSSDTDVSTMSSVQDSVPLSEEEVTTSSSVTSHEGGSSSDTNHSDAISVEDGVQLYDEVVITSSSSSSADSDD